MSYNRSHERRDNHTETVQTEKKKMQRFRFAKQKDMSRGTSHSQAKRTHSLMDKFGLGDASQK